MAQLEEITNVPVIALGSLGEESMKALLDIARAVMGDSIAFPLTLSVTDQAGYFVEMIMRGPGIWPEITDRRDADNMDDRRCLFPFDIYLRDAEGRHARIVVVADIFERKITLSKQYVN